MYQETSDILAGKIKLNLGCGNKILPGYINVDAQEEIKGMKPDLVHDIIDLKDKFADNSIDEILTVHVIEHFYYWYLQDILAEWKRILKPGAVMVTETPNLLFACQQIINNPYKAALPDGQKSTWVLYGNPYEKSELDCHHWCFTPQTLSQLFAEAGFTNIRQEAAQFKLREPRDFRIVCEKPLGE